MKPFLRKSGIRTFGSSQAGRGDDADAQRIEPRYHASNRCIRILVDGQECNFLLSNVSANGAAGSCDYPLQPDQSVHLVFEGQEEVLGIVRWTRDSAAGIQFVDAISHHLVQGPGNGALPARAPRFKVSRRATIMGDFPPCAASIRNISTRGMLVETSQFLHVGQDIEIRCGRMLPMQAQVRWTRTGQAGLLLVLPIALDEFEELTADAVL